MNAMVNNENQSTKMNASRPTALKKIVMCVLAVACFIVIGIVVLEIALRILAPTPWYERLVKEQTHQESVGRMVGNDKLTLRHPLVETEKPPKTHRTMMIGDSFTYGWGVQDDTKIFPYLVEKKLNEQRPVPDFDRYEIYNGGVPGSRTQAWVSLFKATVDTYEPDIVLIVFFLRDGVLGVTSNEQITMIREGMERLKERSFLFRHSRIYRFLRERSEQQALAEQYLGRLKSGYLGQGEETSEWVLSKSNLLLIQDECLRRRIRFAVVIFPVLFQLDENYPLNEACDEIERFCLDSNIAVMSLLPAFMHKDAPTLWISPLDQHPNEHGHAIAADEIYGFVETLIRVGG